MREIKLAREQEQANAAGEKEEFKQRLQRQMQAELMVSDTDYSITLNYWNFIQQSQK